MQAFAINPGSCHLQVTLLGMSQGTERANLPYAHKEKLLCGLPEAAMTKPRGTSPLQHSPFGFGSRTSHEPNLLLPRNAPEPFLASGAGLRVLKRSVSRPPGSNTDFVADSQPATLKDRQSAKRSATPNHSTMLGRYS